MRKYLILLLLALMCSGCSALPAEERSFAVALGVQESGGTWEVSARMPTYQTGGGYMTLTARGTSLGEALTLLNVSSPMPLHLGQLRLVAFHQGIAESTSFRNALTLLAERQDFRLQAIICVTSDKVSDLMDQLEPATGSRLSKSLDVLLEARRTQGVISAVTLSDLLRMGERQAPVLTSIALEDDADVAHPGMDASAGKQAASGGGKVQFGGGWMVNSEGSVKGELTAGEMQLLSLVSGTLKKGMISVQEGTVNIMDASARIKLDGNAVSCNMDVRYTSSSWSEEGVEKEIQSACESVIGKLAAAGCDALGIGRRAIHHFTDMSLWRQLEWRILYPQLDWTIDVRAQRAA